MTSLRKEGDRPAARRGTSPAPSATMHRVRPSSASSSRPSSTPISPDKEHTAAAKPIPNYLKPTLSSKAPDAGAHPKAKTLLTATKRLTRIKSMEKPPAHHPHPHPHPARTSPAASTKSSSTALKSSTAASPSSARASASSSRTVTDGTRKPSPKSSTPGVTKARAAVGSASGKKKEPGSSASKSLITVTAHHEDAMEEGLENAEPKTITIITDPASPSAQEDHHEETEHDGLQGGGGGEHPHPEEEEEDDHHHYSPEMEESHDLVPEPEEESQPASADSPPHDVAKHKGSPKLDSPHGGHYSLPAFEENTAEDHSISNNTVPAAETSKFLTRSRTVPARPKPTDAAKIPVDDELQRKLMSRKAWETGSGTDSTSPKDGGEEASGPEFKRQDTLGKKESPAYNDVIGETASKLKEKRKNKVLALAGAFETVISLQEPKTPPSGTQSPSTAPAGGSGAGEMHTPPAVVPEEGDNTAADSAVDGDHEPHNCAADEEVPTWSEDVVTESNQDEGNAGRAPARE